MHIVLKHFERFHMKSTCFALQFCFKDDIILKLLMTHLRAMTYVMRWIRFLKVIEENLNDPSHEIGDVIATNM